MGNPRTKKLRVFWNTHSIQKSMCAFLCIMIRVLGYLCIKFQSLTSLRCRDMLITHGQTDGWKNGRTGECEFINQFNSCLIFFLLKILLKIINTQQRLQAQKITEKSDYKKH